MVPEARAWEGGAWGGAGAHLEAGGLGQVEELQEDAVQLAVEVAVHVRHQPQERIQNLYAVCPGGVP